MNVGELIEALEQMDEDAEVRLALQPNYPFEHEIDGISKGEYMSAQGFLSEDGDGNDVVYIFEGQQKGYFTYNRDAFEYPEFE